MHSVVHSYLCKHITSYAFATCNNLKFSSCCRCCCCLYTITYNGYRFHINERIKNIFFIHVFSYSRSVSLFLSLNLMFMNVIICWRYLLCIDAFRSRRFSSRGIKLLFVSFFFLVCFSEILSFFHFFFIFLQIPLAFYFPILVYLPAAVSMNEMERERKRAKQA